MILGQTKSVAKYPPSFKNSYRQRLARLSYLFVACAWNTIVSSTHARVMMSRTPKLLLSTCVLLCCVVWGAFAFYPRPVQGVVKDALNGEPVARAAIEAGGRSSPSSETGRFDLGWLLGDPTLMVWADGYLPVEAIAPRDRLPGLRAICNIALTPNAVSLRVRDAESGAALVGSVVAMGTWSEVTDQEGRATLRRVKTGAVLSASSAGYKTATAVFKGQQSQEFALQPVEVRVHVVDLYSGSPLPSAIVTCGSLRLSADQNGVVVVKRLAYGMQFTVQATDHDVTRSTWDGSESVQITMRPNILRGVIVDQDSGKPLAGATAAVISAGQVISHCISDPGGHYSCRTPPSPAVLVIAAPGYERAKLEIAATTEMHVSLSPFKARAVYMPLGILTDEERVKELVDLIDRTELNAIVVDVKNDRGWLAYPSDVHEAQRSDTFRHEVMQLSKFLSICQEHGVYTIARLVLFKDPSLAVTYPQWAVRTSNGDVWEDLSGIAWTDPFVEQVQDYNLAIAREVAMMGFDELQFDYLRFPSDGDVADARYAEDSTFESRCTMIREFAARLRGKLQPYAVLLAADLFGMTAWVTPEDDLGIGQRVVDVAPYMDYLCPMLYPSTFGSGSVDITEPLLHPYEIVYRSCLGLTARTKTRVRPWLQHYSWGDVTYGLTELRLEKQAAEEAAAEGWMFWNSAGIYEQRVFDAVRNVQP